MIEENFICPTCQKKHAISSYTITSDQRFLKKNSRDQLKCDCKDKSILKEIEKDIDWSKGCAAFGKVMSMSPQQRSEVLKKRAKVDFKKNIEERKIEMNRAFNKEARETQQGK